jgi:hypothetical protein
MQVGTAVQAAVAIRGKRAGAEYLNHDIQPIQYHLDSTTREKKQDDRCEAFRRACSFASRGRMENSL